MLAVSGERGRSIGPLILSIPALLARSLANLTDLDLEEPSSHLRYGAFFTVGNGKSKDLAPYLGAQRYDVG